MNYDANVKHVASEERFKANFSKQLVDQAIMSILESLDDTWCRFCLFTALYTQQLHAWTAIVSNMIWQYRTQVQILWNGFDSRLETIVFDVYTGWLLISTAQVRLADYLQYLWTFNSIVISARQPCSSNLQKALLLLPAALITVTKLQKTETYWNV